MTAVLGQVEGERDQHLLARHHDGDPEAFGELYATYFPRLVRFCRNRVNTPHLAEEIAQETFVRAFVASGRLRDGKRFYPWLTVIARRLVIDDFRRNGRVTLMPELDPGEQPGPEVEAVLAEEAEALELALGRVRARHRAILAMRDQGLSYEDMAQRLGTPITTIPPLLHRARLAVRREYEALLEHERIAAVAPALLSMVAAVRRWRNRTAQTLSSLPDLQGAAVPAAGLVMSVAVLLVPSFGEVEFSPMHELRMGGQGLGAQASQGSRPTGNDLESDTSTRAERKQPPPPSHVIGAVEFSTDPERSRWGQERVREMPIHYEFGDTAVGADPNAAKDALDSTMTGDLDWMEGS